MKTIEFYSKNNNLLKTIQNPNGKTNGKSWMANHLANQFSVRNPVWINKYLRNSNGKSFGKSRPQMANRGFEWFFIFFENILKIFENICIIGEEAFATGFDIIIAMSTGGFPNNNYKLAMFANRAHYGPFWGSHRTTDSIGGLFGPITGPVWVLYHSCEYGYVRL
jgi:hypothetical protein